MQRISCVGESQSKGRGGVLGARKVKRGSEGGYYYYYYYYYYYCHHYFSIIISITIAIAIAIIIIVIIIIMKFGPKNIMGMAFWHLILQW